MLENSEINRILGIDESYQAPQRMLDLMSNDSTRNMIFKEFLSVESDLSYEWFQNYFESEHSDRKVKKQDFTPNSVSKLLSLLTGQTDFYFEAAAGTGGIMIQSWNLNRENPDRYYKVEELSDRATPFLLFNMCIRGMNGEVLHGDSLEQNFKSKYFILKNGEFSSLIIK